MNDNTGRVARLINSLPASIREPANRLLHSALAGEPIQLDQATLQELCVTMFARHLTVLGTAEEELAPPPPSATTETGSGASGQGSQSKAAQGGQSQSSGIPGHGGSGEPGEGSGSGSGEGQGPGSGETAGKGSGSGQAASSAGKGQNSEGEGDGAGEESPESKSQTDGGHPPSPQDGATEGQEQKDLEGAVQKFMERHGRNELQNPDRPSDSKSGQPGDGQAGMEEKDGDPGEGPPSAPDGATEGRGLPTRDAKKDLGLDQEKLQKQGQKPEPQPKPGEASTDGSRGAGGNPNEAAKPEIIDPPTPEELTQLAAEADLEAFLKVLERIIKGRAKKPGGGKSRWVQWQPGDVFTEPDEIIRYREDDAYGVDPLQRRCMHRRDEKLHLVVVAMDSSGSVDNQLFALLHSGMSKVADIIGEVDGVVFGVCQFSGGAAWTLTPTQQPEEIEALAKQPPVRLFHGSTVVNEVLAILGDEIGTYKSCDLVVFTDGYVENGRELAAKVDAFANQWGTELKVHGMIFRGRGSTEQFERAKGINPRAFRVWHIGEEPPKPEPAAQAAKQQQALENLSPQQKDDLRKLRDQQRKK